MTAASGTLIVDSSPTTGEAIAAQLAQLGFADVEQAADAQAALRRLRERTFALVIADWRLPAMSGLELLRRIRHDGALKGIRFLLISTSAHPQLADTARKLGADGVLTRPFDADALKAATAAAFASER